MFTIASRLSPLYRLCLVGLFVSRLDAQAPSPLFSDDFSDGDRNGWFELNDSSSTLSAKSTSGQMGSLPALSFTTTDPKSLHSWATHFPETELKQTGDSVTLQFDARHNNSGFINRGFRFGVFHSSGTPFKADGDLSTGKTSLDDKGYFAMVDLGGSTTEDSAVIRESNNVKDARLWEGGRVAFDAPDETSDPLIFTREKNYHYSLTLTRNDKGSVDIVLKNNASGEKDALLGTSKLTPTLKFDTIYFGTLGSSADFAIDNVAVSQNSSLNSTNLAQTTNPSPPSPLSPKTGRGGEIASNDVRIGVYVDEGAGPSVNDLLSVLRKFDGVSVTQLKAGDFRSDKLAGFDLLMQPGGSGGGQGRKLGEEGRDAIRGFVKAGGGFVGICAGSYLASADYEWSLNILDAKVVDRQHWNRGIGTVDIVMTNDGRKLLGSDKQKLSIHYAQGPLLAPGNKSDIEDYEVVATFETEIAKNGAPEGVMKGTTAIAKGKFGNGRVICFSPHPEMTNGLEQMVRLAIEHVKRDRKQH